MGKNKAVKAISGLHLLFDNFIPGLQVATDLGSCDHPLFWASRVVHFKIDCMIRNCP
jgi:hypothetical protein